MARELSYLRCVCLLGVPSFRSITVHPRPEGLDDLLRLPHPPIYLTNSKFYADSPSAHFVPQVRAVELEGALVKPTRPDILSTGQFTERVCIVTVYTMTTA